jgi:hypothetical protein
MDDVTASSKYCSVCSVLFWLLKKFFVWVKNDRVGTTETHLTRIQDKRRANSVQGSVVLRDTLVTVFVLARRTKC